MATPILSLGGDKWAIGESKLLGYNKLNNNYLANEFVVTRATSSRLTNKQGVIEDSCYNLLQRSEEFDNVVWVKASGTINANVITAPNGTLNADLLVEDIAVTNHSVRQNATVQAGTYVLSCYIKASGRDWVLLRDSGFSNGHCYFNVTTGQIGATGVEATNPTIKLDKEGFYLCSINITYPTTQTVSFVVEPRLANSGSTYSGDTSKGIYIWGAQLTIGSELKPYLKTTNRLNVPKIDYSYLGKPTLLSEPQRTNLNLWSEDFTQSNWAKTLITVNANSTLNPFGISKSYTLTEDNTTGLHFLSQATSVTSGTAYTSSFYVKKNNHSWIQFVASTTTFPTGYWVNFNFDTGLFGNNGGSGTWAAKQLTNGYWLITTTNTAISTGSNSHSVIAGIGGVDTTLRLPGYLGTNSNICDVAAIQLEQGSNTTTYIPTTTATVTRSGDTCYHDLSTVAALNQNNFTLFVEGYNYNTISATNLLFAMSDSNSTSGLDNNYIGFQAGMVANYRYNSGSQITVGSALSSNSYYKCIIQINGSTIKIFRNGAQLGTTQTSTSYNYRYLKLNNGLGGTYSVAKLDLYNETLTDAECIAMTTL